MARPLDAPTDARPTFLRVWSTISTPLLFAAAAWLLVDQDVGVATGVAAFAVVFVAIEAIARGHFVGFLASLALVLAVGVVALSLAVGLGHQWQLALAIVLGAAAVLTLAVNIRDLRRT
jgi:hypothetical protein